MSRTGGHAPAARNDPATRSREGLSSVGLGPAALAGLAAASTALFILLCSVACAASTSVLDESVFEVY
ncbi:hypothetical protein CLM82_26055, partial [Streptomyces albidoflavus]